MHPHKRVIRPRHEQGLTFCWGCPNTEVPVSKPVPVPKALLVRCAGSPKPAVLPNTFCVCVFWLKMEPPVDVNVPATNQNVGKTKEIQILQEIGSSPTVVKKS